MNNEIFTDVEVKIRKKNKILFARQSESLQSLLQKIRTQNHRVIVLWCMDCAKILTDEFQRFKPEERRLNEMISLCEQWSSGEIKMNLAKRAILDVHAAAKTYKEPYLESICHAVGHAGASIHVETHAIGMVLYDCSAIVQKYQFKGYEDAVLERIRHYEERLRHWEVEEPHLKRKWISFLQKDSDENKEKKLYDKNKI